VIRPSATSRAAIYSEFHHFRRRTYPCGSSTTRETAAPHLRSRHTFATFALRAGISTLDLSGCVGASLTIIDRHYGLLLRDGREHAIRQLDELSAGQRPRWTLVDAAWTSKAAGDASRDNGTVG